MLRVMARSRRVRQLRTIQLEEEAAELMAASLVGDELNEAQTARLGRLWRELARRDYRFRAHGRGCTCADCCYLLDQWVEHRRRWWPDEPLPSDDPR